MNLKNKKILKICSPQLGMDPNSDLGGEVHDHFILQGLANLGHKIFVYLPKERPYQKNSNIVVTRAPFKHILAITFNLLVIPYLFKTYYKDKFDILRVHNPYFVGLAALLFKFLNPKVPVVVTHHLIPQNFLFDLLNRIFAKKYDAIITVSNYVKNKLAKRYKLPSKKIFVIYNGVAKGYKFVFKNPKLIKKYNLESKIVLLFMGLLIDRKNPMYLLELFKNIKINRKNTSLMICGRGPLEAKMKSFVKDNKIQDVIFTGTVFDKDKIDHLNLCDIYLHPAIDEGLPLSTLEAMACQKPVIINDAYSASEIIENGKNGFICKINNKADWLEKINKLVINKNLRQEMGIVSARLIKEKFQWHYSVKEHLKVYETVIKINQNG